jgi:methenyltetrahydromethanopterin cyclohydrolase
MKGIAPNKKKFNHELYDLVFTLGRGPTKANALKAQKHYKEKGYNARLVSASVEGKTVYRVYVRRKV